MRTCRATQSQLARQSSIRACRTGLTEDSPQARAAGCSFAQNLMSSLTPNQGPRRGLQDSKSPCGDVKLNSAQQSGVLTVSFFGRIFEVQKRAKEGHSTTDKIEATSMPVQKIRNLARACQRVQISYYRRINRPPPPVHLDALVNMRIPSPVFQDGWMSAIYQSSQLVIQDYSAVQTPE